MDLENKIDIVKNILKGKKVAIGFSGGADSTLIAYLSSKVAKDTIAITINNHLMPSDFIENTKKTAESFGIRHEIVDINFYEDEDFLKNSAKRCFTCRDMMYSTIKNVARENDFDFMTIWNSRYECMRNRKWAKIGRCAKCSSWRWCEGNGLHLHKDCHSESLHCGLIENTFPTFCISL